MIIIPQWIFAFIGMWFWVPILMIFHENKKRILDQNANYVSLCVFATVILFVTFVIGVAPYLTEICNFVVIKP